MRIFIERQTYGHPYNSQWTVTKNIFADVKKDGTRDKRKAPREGRRQVHTHTNGHKRYYLDGCLVSEKYVELAWSHTRLRSF